MQYPQDEIWLQELGYGKERAYQRLFDQYYRLLAIFSFKYLNDRQQAEDAVHDVLLSLYQQKERFNSITLLKSYLFNAVRNRCLNILEHQKVAREYTTKIIQLTGTNLDEYNYIESEVYEQLREAIRQLPEVQRRVFDLTLQGYDNAAIAEEMGISEDAVKSHKKRGKKLLKEKLQHLMYWSLIINWLVNNSDEWV